jgi:hypothetical protein
VLLRPGRVVCRACRRGAQLAIALALSLCAALALPAFGAADNVYWSDSSSGVLRTGNLSGTGAASLLTGLQSPGGIVLAPTAGKIYWAEAPEAAAGKIQVGELNGAAAPQTLYTEPAGARPADLAIDAGAGKLYWTDEGSGAIETATTAGGGAPSVLYSEPQAAHPSGIAIDSAAGKLYWTDEGSGEIREGALGGGSAKTLYKEPEGSRPSDIAIASSTGRVYWTDAGSGTIRDAPMSGSGEAQTLYTDPAGSAPRGLALDAATGSLYWADSGLSALRTASLAGGGVAQSLFSSEAAAAYPALLGAPKGEGVPPIAGSVAIGQTLTCGNGQWGSNAPGADFYQAPQAYAYQWQLNGTNIAGAQSSTFKLSGEGSFTCVVTATNAAGSATQTSAAAVTKVGPPKVSIASPTTGGSYEQGQAVSTSFSCSEGAGGPGLASCTDSNGTKAPSGHLNTMSVGLFTYTVTAVSKDGQRTTASVNYLVLARKAPSAPPPAPPPKLPTITIASSSAQVRGRTTTVTLTCSGSASCRGVLSLTYLTSTRTHGSDHTTELLFARMTYALPPGQRGRVSLQLSGKARGLLLKAPGRHLTVRARATVGAGVPKHRAVVLRLG